jgi:hypothetical protein
MHTMEALPLIAIALALAFLRYPMLVPFPPLPSHSIGAYKAHDLVDPLSTFKNRNQTISQCNVSYFSYATLFMC